MQEQAGYTRNVKEVTQAARQRTEVTREKSETLNDIGKRRDRRK